MNDDFLETPLKKAYLETLARQARNNSAPFDYYPIETGALRKAIPDTYIMLGKYNGWLEFKRMRESGATVEYHPGQLNELRLLRLRGIFSATVGLTAGMDYVVAIPNTVLLQKECEKRKVSLYGAKEYYTGSMEDVFEGLYFMMARFYAKS